jgi:hypothetical protein
MTLLVHYMSSIHGNQNRHYWPCVSEAITNFSICKAQCQICSYQAGETYLTFCIFTPFMLFWLLKAVMM